MRFLFVTIAQLQQGPAGPTFSVASARYRVLIPAQQLARLGHDIKIDSVPPGRWPPSAQGHDFDVLVISKSGHPVNEELAKAMRARGVKVVADFCDDHFENPVYRTHYRNLAQLADQVVASTPAMAEAIRRHTGRQAMVISDPVEGPRGLPKFAPRFPALRIVWFGHPTNLNGLAAKAAELHALAARMPVRLTVVTTPSDTASALVAALAAGAEGRVQAELIPWSLEATWKAIEQADLAWIPVVDSDVKAVKSPNRLLEPLWAGRLVVADPVPSYLPFADLVPIGTGLERGVVDALEDPARIELNLREAQRRIARLHSAFECGRQWARALGDTTVRPLRLNLGCGDKILPGYVNVDVVEARAGMKPDVICDLHDLAPFEDDSADEILSVHVVEHFWRWEIRDVLREWVRVLKPGGRMIVECPNLLSACQTFLQNPDQFSREDSSGQRTMWVFYGDPGWKDPLMIHRWGYTPGSLTMLLQEAGLANVHQEPAQFKLREPRDMRIVGTKP
ncbi:MAG: methyltransferase domain-containing protein [Pseudomonadota bacterium]